MRQLKTGTGPELIQGVLPNRIRGETSRYSCIRELRKLNWPEGLKEVTVSIPGRVKGVHSLPVGQQRGPLRSHLSLVTCDCDSINK